MYFSFKTICNKQFCNYSLGAKDYSGERPIFLQFQTEEKRGSK